MWRDPLRQHHEVCLQEPRNEIPVGACGLQPESWARDFRSATHLAMRTCSLQRGPYTVLQMHRDGWPTHPALIQPFNSVRCVLQTRATPTIPPYTTTHSWDASSGVTGRHSHYSRWEQSGYKQYGTHKAHCMGFQSYRSIIVAGILLYFTHILMGHVRFPIGALDLSGPPPQPPVQWAPDNLSPGGVKWPGRESDHLPSSVKNGGAIPPPTHMSSSHGAYQLNTGISFYVFYTWYLCQICRT
jgi:hypothetical protein